MTARIALPWPNRALSSNGQHGGWRKKWAATKAARRDACLLAKGEGAHRVPGPHRLSLEYFPPDNRRRDVQNMPAMLKAYIDGIADAMGVDDREFAVSFPERFSACRGAGAIEVTIETDSIGIGAATEPGGAR